MQNKKGFLQGLEVWKAKISAQKYKLIIALLILLLAGYIQSITGNYTAERGAVEVTDMVLSNIPPIDLSILFTYGFLFIQFLMFIYPLIWKIEQMHAIIFQYSLMGIVRAGFIIMTHLKTPADAIPFNFPWPFSILVGNNDLFFSGHTAVAFLGFLIFKDSKIRWVFLIGSFVMAATVLLMHRHYTIDVLAAYFITFGTYKLGNLILRKLGWLA